MRALTELLIGGIDLVKAELRQARQSAGRLTVGMVLAAVAGLFISLALGLLLLALLLALRHVMPWPAALMVVGLVCALVAAGLAWFAQRNLRS